MAVAERELAAPSIAEEDDAPRPFLWTREQYYEMGNLGWLEGRRVERIYGEIIQMPPMGRPHRTSVILAGPVLQRAFGDGCFVAAQVPLELGERNDPEPDVAVFQGSVRDYADAPLASALLVVEISEATLRYDRATKASVYAESGIADYWIVNLKARQLEVHRQPGPLSDVAFGYGEITIYKSGETVAPLAAQASPVAVDDLLP